MDASIETQLLDGVTYASAVCRNGDVSPVHAIAEPTFTAGAFRACAGFSSGGLARCKLVS